jgi:hypothetical protein
MWSVPIFSLVSKDGMAPLKRRKPEAPAAE